MWSTKKVVNIFTLRSNLSAKVWLTISQAIKLIQWEIQRIFSILGYFSVIISLAFLIFAALSDTIADIRLGPIFSITSSIFLAKYSEVWESKERSESW